MKNRLIHLFLSATRIIVAGESIQKTNMCSIFPSLRGEYPSQKFLESFLKQFQNVLFLVEKEMAPGSQTGNPTSRDVEKKHIVNVTAVSSTMRFPTSMIQPLFPGRESAILMALLNKMNH